jgi:hypothetical protein
MVEIKKHVTSRDTKLDDHAMLYASHNRRKLVMTSCNVNIAVTDKVNNWNGKIMSLKAQIFDMVNFRIDDSDHYQATFHGFPFPVPKCASQPVQSSPAYPVLRLMMTDETCS